jgi:hypothetical protein
MSSWLDLEMHLRLEVPDSYDPALLDRGKRAVSVLRGAASVDADECHVTDVVEAIEQLANVVVRARVSGKVEGADDE